MEGLDIRDLRIKQKSIIDEIESNSRLIQSLNKNIHHSHTIEEQKLIANKASVYIDNVYKLTEENTKIERFIKKRKGVYEPCVNFRNIEDEAFNEEFDRVFGNYV